MVSKEYLEKSARKWYRKERTALSCAMLKALGIECKYKKPIEGEIVSLERARGI